MHKCMYMYLFKTRSDPKSDVYQYRPDMTFVNLVKDLSKTRHGFHCDKIFRVFFVVHSCQHSAKDGRRELGYLNKTELIIKPIKAHTHTRTHHTQSTYLVTSNAGHIAKTSYAVYAHHVV